MEYQPLGDGEIRLLSIRQPLDSLSGVGSQARQCPHPEERVDYELLHRTFHDCRISSTFSLEGPETAFVALSHTWGSEDEQESIHVNGSAIEVRRNLKNALEALRETDVVKRGCMVWADAMCINQGDPKEKSKLVPKMGEIYRKSWCVVKWLGDATTGSDEAFDFINGVCEARERSLAATTEFLEYMSTCKRLCTVWESLKDVVYRPYFSRLWIMQELAMSCDRSLVLCGKKITTWGRMRKVYQCLRILERDLEDDKFKDILRDVILGHDDVKSAYERVPNYHWKVLDDYHGLQDLEARKTDHYQRCLITRCRIAKCQSPQDKVYGMLALLRDDLASQIVANYEHDLQTVYADFTRKWIETMDDLNLLGHCGGYGDHYQREEALDCSWAVNLSKEIKQQTSNYHCRYRANGDMKACYRFQDTDLIVSGVIVDKIDGFSGRRHWNDDSGELVDFLGSESHRNPYGADADYEEAIWRTLVGDRNHEGDRAPEKYACVLDIAILDKSCLSSDPTSNGNIDEVQYNLHLWWIRNAEMRIKGKPLASYLGNMDILQKDPKTYNEAAGRVDRFLWNRRLVSTASGYVGIMPHFIQKGDIIAVIGGCAVPLVLRPRWQQKPGRLKYEILGECFVYGIMDGEIEQSAREGRHALVDIMIS